MTQTNAYNTAGIGAAKPRSMLISYLLWFFLGSLGAHRYYNGRLKTGLGMLALTVVGWLTVGVKIGALFLLAVSVWWVVDAFMIPRWAKATTVV
jgi:TM2 domain-containing membrane protein YozV